MLGSRYSKLEDKVGCLESSANQVEQYGKTINIVLSGILTDDKLEDAVSAIQADVDVNNQNDDIEACRRIG